MYLLYNLCKYSIVLDDAARRLKIEATRQPDRYEVAKEKAHKSAMKDKKHVLRRVVFRAWGIKLGGKVDNRERMRQQDQPAARSKDWSGAEMPSPPAAEDPHKQ
jgi:hypothetical protein